MNEPTLDGGDWFACDQCGAPTLNPVHTFIYGQMRDGRFCTIRCAHEAHPELDRP